MTILNLVLNCIEFAMLIVIIILQIKNLQRSKEIKTLSKYISNNNDNLIIKLRELKEKWGGQ